LPYKLEIFEAGISAEVRYFSFGNSKEYLLTLTNIIKASLFDRLIAAGKGNRIGTIYASELSAKKLQFLSFGANDQTLRST
jgi:hypothetical protein